MKNIYRKIKSNKYYTYVISLKVHLKESKKTRRKKQNIRKKAQKIQKNKDIIKYENKNIYILKTNN